MISLRFRAPSAIDWTTASFLGDDEDEAACLLITALGSEFCMQVRRGSSFAPWVGADEFDFEEEE